MIQKLEDFDNNNSNLRFLKIVLYKTIFSIGQTKIPSAPASFN